MIIQWFLFWPKPDYIISNLNSGWLNCKPKRLILDDLEIEIFALIESQDYLINVFPINGKTGFVVNLDEFARDLSDALKKYWDRMLSFISEKPSFVSISSIW